MYPEAPHVIPSIYLANYLTPFGPLLRRYPLYAGIAEQPLGCI